MNTDLQAVADRVAASIRNYLIESGFSAEQADSIAGALQHGTDRSVEVLDTDPDRPSPVPVIVGLGSALCTALEEIDTLREHVKTLGQFSAPSSRA